MKKAGCKEVLCPVIKRDSVGISSWIIRISKEINMDILRQVFGDAKVIGRFVEVELLLKEC